MTEKNIHIAHSDLTGAFNPFQLFAGDTDVITQPELVFKQAGSIIPQFTALTRDATTGKFRPAVVATGVPEKVTAIAPYDIDARAADVSFSLYKSGYFNVAALVWDATFTTLLLKQTAVDGTAINIREIPAA